MAFSGDDGLTVVERASYGVIGAITPTTNPTETIINNGIGMVAGGNAVVFNVHPYAARTSAPGSCTCSTRRSPRRAARRTCSACVEKPTIESAQALMEHPGVRLLVVTGGPGVVKAAMDSGKKAIAAGPGNPPAVVDETADLDDGRRPASSLGASIDNNIICTAEKEVIAVASIADALQGAAGAQRLPGAERPAAARAREGGAAPGVGRRRPRQQGLRRQERRRDRPADRRHAPATSCGLLIAEVDEKHPFVQHELLMPVLPLVRVPDVAEAIAMAKRVEHGFGHTAVMYSRNIDHLHAMARTINTSIFVKNASNLAGLGPGRRGLHVVHHRLADGRGADHGPQLHARAALHAEGILPHRHERCSWRSSDAAAGAGADRARVDRARLPGGRRHGQARAGHACCVPAGQPGQVPGAGRRRGRRRRRGVPRRPGRRPAIGSSIACSCRTRTRRCGPAVARRDPRAAEHRIARRSSRPRPRSRRRCAAPTPRSRRPPCASSRCSSRAASAARRSSRCRPAGRDRGRRRGRGRRDGRALIWRPRSSPRRTRTWFSDCAEATAPRRRRSAPRPR